ncbi:MAG: 2'-5' RNA ligase family protein [Pseudomonadota bacterium]
MSHSYYSRLFEDRDHTEWHGGHDEYGFWCFRVEHPAWLVEFERLQSELQAELLDGYQRFPHITLATVGLMDEQRWTIVDQQIAQINASNVCPVNAGFGCLDSFDHSPMISVLDNEGGLEAIRRVLHAVSRGDDPDAFTPHLTLGYYSRVVLIDSVLRPLQARCVEGCTLKQLLFCTFDTRSIKGPISVKRTVKLASEAADASRWPQSNASRGSLPKEA